VKTATRDESVLFLDGWLEFNRTRWGLTPARRTYRAEVGTLPMIETVLYLNAKGRVVHAPRSPYLPVVFSPTGTQATSRLYRQWLEVADMFAADCEGLGLARPIAFPPEITDVRPWQWRGFRIGVRYTFYLDLPYDEASADAAVGNKMRKALSAGYRAARETDMRAVYACLLSTEGRQGFSHELSLNDLNLVRALLGDDHCRAYICRSAEGKAVSARVVLHATGTRAIDWVAGTESNHLNSGATQLTIACALEDLHASGATGFDFAGADRRNIATAKSTWGGVLTRYHTLEAPNTRFLLKTLRDMTVRLIAPRPGHRESRC
jgi:hypothetical protein